MVLKNTPLRPPLDNTIFLFGQRVYRDTRLYNNRQGLSPLPFFQFVYEVRQYRLAGSLLFGEHSLHSRIFQIPWLQRKSPTIRDSAIFHDVLYTGRGKEGYNRDTQMPVFSEKPRRYIQRERLSYTFEQSHMLLPRPNRFSS